MAAGEAGAPTSRPRRPRDAHPRVPPLAEIRRRLADREAPAPAGTGHAAATALILHAGRSGPEALFIRRSERPGDPWSGHVALPGGRREPADEHLAATAAREAAEEVGVALDTPLARLDAVAGRTRGPGVVPYVFAVGGRPELQLETREVARAMWVPLAHLLDDDRRTRHPVRGVGPFPGIRLGDDVLWGLTLRIMERFFAALGLRLR